MSDLLLWQSLKKGNKDALASIYDIHFDYLYNYGLKLSTQDPSLVEDCIQELFIDIWSKRANLSDTDSIRPYLTVALRRAVVKKLKKQKNMISDVEVEDHHFGSELSIDQVITARELDIEMKAKLKDAFSSLSARQKEILYLKYHAEMSYDEISEAMEMNYQSARNLVSRAIQKLSKTMKFIISFFMIIN